MVKLIFCYHCRVKISNNIPERSVKKSDLFNKTSTMPPPPPPLLTCCKHFSHSIVSSCELKLFFSFSFSVPFLFGEIKFLWCDTNDVWSLCTFKCCRTFSPHALKNVKCVSMLMPSQIIRSFCLFFVAAFSFYLPVLSYLSQLCVEIVCFVWLFLLQSNCSGLAICDTNNTIEHNLINGVPVMGRKRKCNGDGSLQNYSEELN